MDGKITPRFERQAALRENSFVNELALIVFTIFAGLCGLWTENVSVTMTIFGGGVVAWMAFSFPEQYRKQAERKAKQPSAPATDKGTGEPSAAAGHLNPDAAMALISSRRSVKGRDFNGQAVDRELVERVLQAANWAPSHRLTQPWRFVVLEGGARDELMDATEAVVRAPDNGMSDEKRAAVLTKLAGKRKTLQQVRINAVAGRDEFRTLQQVPYLIVLGMKAHAVAGVHVAEVEEVCAAACAIQNLHLMATSLGLAGFWDSWTAARDADSFKEWAGLVSEDKVLGVFYLGRSERLENYRGTRGPWQDKVAWRS